ncbi:MAG: NADH-ubiquinone oxidoreductase-F iron-sulfur binding region domain-containing protein [Weeksellaceae bacterium]|nr:NADH-ubiquinone oxidoreductase-F iron-sulfur binding region domain-containing protein [Weeksellaceae bacterium]
MSRNLSHLAGNKDFTENLFEKYAAAASVSGTPDKQELAQLAEDFLIGDANTLGAISAFDFLKPENKGKKVYVCNGSACLCAQTQDNVHEKLQAFFGEDEIGHMTCLGRCHENSSFHYHGNNYSGDSINHLYEILHEPVENEFTQDKYTVQAKTAMITAAPPSLEEWKEMLQSALDKDPKLILEEVIQSKIRGRGGAGFPMGMKWEACGYEEADRKYIVCNADEGDPGAFTDRYILNEQPQKLLYGMMMAGYCVGAEYGIIYIRGEYPESVRSARLAVEEFVQAGMAGENILGTGFNFHFKVVKAQGAYICGEETALLNSLEGQRPEVRTRPPYPTVHGLFMKPTIVNNVETLAAIPWILNNGGKAYSEMGTDNSSGTKLISLDSYFVNGGVVEVEMGTPLREVIYDIGGGFREEVKALHIGGPLGGIVPKEKWDDLLIDFGSFAQHGFLLGHASILSIPEKMPMIEYLEHLMDFASFESCGKCFPCRIGTRRAWEMLHGAHVDGKKISRHLFDDLLDTLQQGSLCAHGGGIPLPMRNALQYFGDELQEYFHTESVNGYNKNID